MEDRKISL